MQNPFYDRGFKGNETCLLIFLKFLPLRISFGAKRSQFMTRPLATG